MPKGTTERTERLYASDSGTLLLRYQSAPDSNGEIAQIYDEIAS